MAKKLGFKIRHEMLKDMVIARRQEINTMTKFIEVPEPANALDKNAQDIYDEYSL